MKTPRRALALLVLVLAAPLACTPPPSPKPPAQEQEREAAPRWSDVFAGDPDLYAVVRPQALMRDKVYGSFWRALVRAAQARGFARGATMLEAVEGAEEIVVGVGRGDDAALVLRGVPAKLDPGKVADARGAPLFRARDERARVVEYELVEAKGVDGALFVLPDRSWVGALGAARARARRAFARPTNRTAPAVDAGALAVVRVKGPLARAVSGPVVGRVLRNAVQATFTLEPGAGGLVVVLVYPDEAASASAQAEAERVAAELSKDERYGWLEDATIDREGASLSLRLTVPPRLLEELPTATGADVEGLAP